jgi:drug/metabolite transporter (DMT)-like permease
MGVLLTVASTICLALAGILYSYCFTLKPNLSPAVIAMVRILVGFLPPLLFVARYRSILPLLGNNRRDLAFWGLAGSATVTTFFFSTQLVGVGITQMLSSVQGLVFFCGAPFLLKERLKWQNLIGLIFSIIGLNFVIISRNSTSIFKLEQSIIESRSILYGLLSGIFGGIAYLFMVRCRRTNCPEVIAFYWAVPSLILQIFLVFYLSADYKNKFSIYSYLVNNITNIIWFCALLGGILTATSQLLLAESYRHGNAVLLTLITYLGPLINLSVDVISGKILLNYNLKIGFFLIVFGSGVFPLFSPKTLKSIYAIMLTLPVIRPLTLRRQKCELQSRHNAS